MGGNTFTEPARTARLEAIGITGALLAGDQESFDALTPTDAWSMPPGVRDQYLGLLGLLRDLARLLTNPEDVLDGLAAAVIAYPVTTQGD